MRKLLLSIFLTTTIIVSACHHNTTLYEPVTLNHRGEFGPILLASHTTIPWSEAAPALEPNFTMENGDTALDKVLHSTALLRKQVLDAFRIGLGVGLPQTSTTSSRVTSTDLQTATTVVDGIQSTNQTTTANDNTSNTTNTSPGDAPDPLSTTTPSNTLPGRIDKQSEVGINPYLQYKAAQSLYQSVMLLNREIQDAAIRKGYVPHVVMLKLKPMLYRRNLPYDIHAKVSFFNRTKKGQTPPAKLPYVVPIIATDNLERAIKSNSVEVSRQIGLALNAMVQGVGVNAGLDNMNRELNAIEANDFNSLLTVGRLTDNSLYIRLGAANQATARFAALSKTYDIATLVLIPKEYYKVKGDGTYLSIISHTELRNALTGKLLLNEIPDEERMEEFDRSFRTLLKGAPSMMEAWENKTITEKRKAISPLVKGIQQSNMGDYYDSATKIELGGQALSGLGTNFINSLWVMLAGNMVKGPLNGASVEVKPSPPLIVPPQKVALRDYGENGMVAELSNVTGARKGGLTARLKYTTGNEFPAKSITIVPETQLLRLGFESSKPWKLNPVGSKIIIEAAECDWDNACPDNKLESDYSVKYLPLPTPTAFPQPKLDLRQTLEFIVADKGTGGVTLFIDNLKEDKVALSIEGARIIGAKDNTSQNALVVKKQQVTLSADGGVDLSLDNLRPGMKVTASATGLKEVPKTKKYTPTGSKKVEFKVVKAE